MAAPMPALAPVESPGSPSSLSSSFLPSSALSFEVEAGAEAEEVLEPSVATGIIAPAPVEVADSEFSVAEVAAWLKD